MTVAEDQAMTTVRASSGNAVDLRVQRLADSDTTFLESVSRDRLRTAKRGPLGVFWRRRRWFSYMARRTAMAFAMVVAVAALACVSSGGVAAAGGVPLPMNKFCTRGQLAPERADSGASYLLPSNGTLVNDPRFTNFYNSKTAESRGLIGIVAGDPDKGPPQTMFAQYLGAGTTWDTYWLDCFSPPLFMNMAANQVFQFSKIISLTSIFVFKFTFSGDAVDFFVKPTTPGSASTFDMLMEQMDASVYTALFGVIVVIAGMVMLWRFIIGRLAASDFWSKFLTMILVAGFALYLGVPGNGSDLLSKVNGWTVGITNSVLTAFAPNSCKAGALECAADNMYNVMIFTPWEIGELGQSTPINGAKRIGERSVGERILTQQAYTLDDITLNTTDPKKYLPSQKNEKVVGTYDNKNNDRSQMLRGWGIEPGGSSGINNPLTDTATSKNNEITQDKAFMSIIPEGKTARYDYWLNFSGGNPGNRLIMAVLAMVAAFALGAVLMIISVSYLLLEISSVIFMLFALPALLLGLIPGFGMRVFLRWLELILGTFAKRIVLGLFVGVLIGICQIIFNLPTQLWLVKMLFVVMVAVFGMVYRKRFVEAFSFSFSGSEGALKPDLIGMFAGKAARKAGGVAKSTAILGADVAMGVMSGGATVPASIARRASSSQGMTAGRGGAKADASSVGSVFDGVSGPSETERAMAAAVKPPVEPRQRAGRVVSGAGGPGGPHDKRLEKAVDQLSRAASRTDYAAGKMGNRSQGSIHVPRPDDSRQQRPESTRPLGRS